MDIKILEEKLVNICLMENEKINDVLRVFSIDDFTGSCKEILKYIEKNARNNTKLELSELSEELNDYILKSLDTEVHSLNFDKYMNMYYEETRKSKLKNALKDFKTEEFDTLKKKVSRVFEEQTNIFETKKTDIASSFDDFYKETEKADDSKLIHLGFKGLNDLITLDEGDVMVIAGNTGLGKTTFALNLILKSILAAKHKVLFVSLEMATSQVLARIISHMTKIELGKLKKKNRKYLTDEEWSSIGLAQSKLVNNLDILDTSNTDIDYVTQQIKEMDKVNNYDYIVIDYLQLLKAEGRSRTEIVTNASLRIKKLARELKPIIALAQLNRENVKRTDKKPLLTDLKDSSQLEQDCSFGILLHSEDYHDKDNKSCDVVDVEVYIDKNRTGPLGMFKTTFAKNVQIFKEV